MTPQQRELQNKGGQGYLADNRWSRRGAHSGSNALFYGSELPDERILTPYEPAAAAKLASQQIAGGSGIQEGVLSAAEWIPHDLSSAGDTSAHTTSTKRAQMEKNRRWLQESRGRRMPIACANCERRKSRFCEIGSVHA